MKWCTTVEIAPERGYMQHNKPMLMIGSCFTEHIGDYMKATKFDIDVNPFGVLYNPLSIAQALTRLMDGTPYDRKELCFDGNLWYSYHHHGKFSQTTAESTIEGINQRFEQAAQQLKKSKIIIVTWGTAYVYSLVENGMIVANCHKQPAKLFTRTRLRIEEIVSCWSNLIEQLQAYTPDCTILFTVSPIRHLSDGAHDNQLSKSTLLLAIEELMRKFPNICRYFPAYEIVNDELRDYRFYAEDMTHPAQQTISYIRQRLKDTYFTQETVSLAESCEKIYRGLQHRPLNGNDTATYRMFAEKLIKQMTDIETKYPYLSFEYERQQLRHNTNVKNDEL